MTKEDIERSLEVMFGKASRKERECITAREKITERIEEMSKTEQQFEGWERMRREAKKRQREDRRFNLFWRRNKTFPKQFCGFEETPNADQTLNLEGDQQ